MRTISLSLVLVAAAGLGHAQQWEFGGTGGLGFLSNVSVSSAIGDATSGFRTGGAFGVFVDHNATSRIGGELRYEYLQSTLHIQSGGSEATFAGRAHAMHYDLILHTAPRGKREFFLALGGGAKVFQGTGAEQAYQPLSQFGYMTKTTVVKPMASIGAGVKYALAPNVFLRTEVRDYITPFPTEVITPAPGTKYGSILHDIVPTVGISFLFQ